MRKPKLVDADAGSGSPRRKDTEMVDSVVAFTMLLVVLVIVLRCIK